MTAFIKDFENIPLLNTDGLYRDMGTVMVVAPHPDDESLGCGGLITYLKAQNAIVWVLFMTNGEASHPNSPGYPPTKLGTLRKNEAVRACKILGVPKHHLIFLNAGDGQLTKYSEGKNSILVKLREILQKRKIETLVIPWRRDHHSDHVATTSMVRKAAEGMELVIAEYPIWLWKKGKPEDWPKEGEILPFKLAIDSVKNKKFKAIQAHVSQTTDLIDDDPDGFVLSTELLEPFMGNYEYFFFPSEAKPAVANTYFDALYSENNDPWNFETSPYEHEKYRNTLNAISNREYKYALEIGCANGVFTEQLAAECKRLLALELNETALKIAKKRCAHLLQCRFLKWDIALGLPKGNFDLIVFSEVGYYFIKEKLQQIFKDVNEILVGGGIFVMVHWTAYVRHYPLTGLQVHEIFANDHSEDFNLKINQRHELYEVLVWEKVEK